MLALINVKKRHRPRGIRERKGIMEADREFRCACEPETSHVTTTVPHVTTASHANANTDASALAKRKYSS